MMFHGAVQANDANDPNQVDFICPDGAMAQQRIGDPDEDGNHKAIADQHLDVGAVDIKIVTKRLGLRIAKSLHDDFLPKKRNVILIQSQPPQRQPVAEKVVHFLHERGIRISPRQDQHHKREQQYRVAGEQLYRFSCNGKPFLEGWPQGIPMDKLLIQLGTDTKHGEYQQTDCACSCIAKMIHRPRAERNRPQLRPCELPATKPSPSQHKIGHVRGKVRGENDAKGMSESSARTCHVIDKIRHQPRL